MSDPTRVDMEADPTLQHFKGVAYHGDTPFDVPFISEITSNLWQGGCQAGLVLPSFITDIVSLYPWERYTVHHNLRTETYVRAYDSDGGIDMERVTQLAVWVNHLRLDEGVVLIHCQAGLNRSSFVAARALMLEGVSAGDAIALLRERRSPAVLCNQAFEEALREVTVS